jgi:hypothetical protein
VCAGSLFPASLCAWVVVCAGWYARALRCRALRCSALRCSALRCSALRCRSLYCVLGCCARGRCLLHREQGRHSLCRRAHGVVRAESWGKKFPSPSALGATHVPGSALKPTIPGLGTDPGSCVVPDNLGGRCFRVHTAPIFTLQPGGKGCARSSASLLCMRPCPHSPAVQMARTETGARAPPALCTWPGHTEWGTLGKGAKGA